MFVKLHENQKYKEFQNLLFNGRAKSRSQQRLSAHLRCRVNQLQFVLVVRQAKELLLGDGRIPHHGSRGGALFDAVLLQDRQVILASIRQIVFNQEAIFPESHQAGQLIVLVFAEQKIADGFIVRAMATDILPQLLVRSAGFEQGCCVLAILKKGDK